MLLLIKNSSIQKIYIRLLEIYGWDRYNCGDRYLHPDIDVFGMAKNASTYIRIRSSATPHIILWSLLELSYLVKAKEYMCGLDESS